MCGGESVERERLLGLRGGYGEGEYDFLLIRMTAVTFKVHSGNLVYF